MFSHNEKISNSQMQKLLIFDITSVSIIILPGIAVNGAGRDGLISIVLGSLAAAIYALFFIYAYNIIKENYMTFSERAIGKFLTFIIGILYIIKLLFSCCFTLILFSNVINDTLLPDTHYNVIVFFLILVSVYAAVKGIEVRARAAEVLFFIVFLTLLLLFVFGAKRVALTNLFPMFTASTRNILCTSYAVLLTYSQMEMLLLAAPSLTNDDHSAKHSTPVIQSILIAAVINITLFVLSLGLLGTSGTARQFKGSITMMQLIQIPGGFVQRQDAIMLMIWLFTVFSILSAYFYYLSKITESLVLTVNRSSTTVFYGIAMFLFSFARIPVETLFYYYGKYMSYIGFPQSICIPLLIIIVSKIRTGKGEGYEKKIV